MIENALDAFIEIAGIKGESTDEAHKDQIEVLSYRHGVAQAGGQASGSGGGNIGRAMHSDFTFMKHIDVASTSIYQRACNGEVIDKVTLRVNQAGAGSRVKYFEVIMEHVYVTAVDYCGDGTPGQRPTEQISLSYGKIKWTYDKINWTTGGSEGAQIATWDLTKNQA